LLLLLLLLLCGFQGLDGSFHCFKDLIQLLRLQVRKMQRKQCIWQRMMAVNCMEQLCWIGTGTAHTRWHVAGTA
jgi:hypothetical protein